MDVKQPSDCVPSICAKAASLCLIVFLTFNSPIWAGVAPKETPERFELEFWRAIKDSTDPAEFQAYLETYPKGRFATLARIRAKSLSRSVVQPQAEVKDQTEVKKEELPVASEAVQEHKVTESKPEAGSESTNLTKTSAEEIVPVAIATPTAPSSESPAPKPATVFVAKSEQERQKMANAEFRDCGACPLMLEIPPGQFVMGADNADSSSAPAHSVTINYGFAAGRYEITHTQWQFCVEQGGCQNNSQMSRLQGQQPAINLSWVDARSYVDWLSEYTMRPYRLPNEAEWEYIARAGTTSPYWWGDEIIPDVANCRDCGGDWGRKLPSPTDAFVANDFGLFSTSGGVAEWVQDCWRANHEQSSADGSAYVVPGCNQRVLRGGSWRNNKSYLSSVSRLSYDHNVRYVANGMRVVLDYDELLEDPE